MPGWKEERFTSPGTWTWPGNTASVVVYLVGGGGGGFSPTPQGTIHGGSGGVRRVYVPVSGPQPVIIGAAGSNNPGSPPNATNIGTAGGSSSFGPVSVGGGGGSIGPGAPTTSNNAPPTGGGGGGEYNNPAAQCLGGLYGHSGGNYGGGGAGGAVDWALEQGARGKFGFARGSQSSPVVSRPAPGYGPTISDALYGASYPSPYSGIVVVQWWEEV